MWHSWKVIFSWDGKMGKVWGKRSPSRKARWFTAKLPNHPHQSLSLSGAYPSEGHDNGKAQKFPQCLRFGFPNGREANFSKSKFRTLLGHQEKVHMARLGDSIACHRTRWHLQIETMKQHETTMHLKNSLHLYVFDSILMQCAMCNVPVPDLFLFLCPCLCHLFPCLCRLFPWRQKQPKLLEVTVFVTKNLRNRLCHHLFQHLAPSKDESDASSLGRKMASKAVTSLTFRCRSEKKTGDSSL